MHVVLMSDSYFIAIIFLTDSYLIFINIRLLINRCVRNARITFMLRAGQVFPFGTAGPGTNVQPAGKRPGHFAPGLKIVCDTHVPGEACSSIIFAMSRALSAALQSSITYDVVIAPSNRIISFLASASGCSMFN